MTVIGKVIELWRYPVSSVAGERVEALDISPAGVRGERNFGVVDSQTGAVARPAVEDRWQRTVSVRARHTEAGTVEVKTAASGWMEPLSAAASAALSDHFGFPTEIRPYQDREAAAGYSGPWAVNRYQPSVVHLLTTASMAELRRLHPQGDPDRRRFRPNIVVEMPAVEGAFPETEWIGRTIRIGSMEFRIEEPTRRCGLTVIAHDDLPHDPDILRQLVRGNFRNLGVYCAPAISGAVQAGDTVHLG